MSSSNPVILKIILNLSTGFCREAQCCKYNHSPVVLSELILFVHIVAHWFIKEPRDS